MTSLSATSDFAFEETRVAAQRSVRPGLGFRFEGVEKSFGDKPVLTGIDLEVSAGQFVAIIGKSGCGKSTLLRLLTGLDTPTGGRIAFDGDATISDTRVMFQEPRLLPWEKVAGNVAVGLTGLATGAEAQERSLKLLADVGLADRAGDWPSVLSGGQRQRVALARALVGQPRIMALDEPLGALDALTRIEMQRLLERIWLSQRFTAVLVTHDVSEAVALADRVIVVRDGRISLDLPVGVARPRRHGDVALATLEAHILDHLFDAAPTTASGDHQ